MKNEILQGDCLELMDVIEDKSVDMILCDLPYGVTQNKWDYEIPLDILWEQYCRIIKDNGVIVLTAQDKFSAKLMLSNEKMHKYNLVWNKISTTGFLNANRMPLRQHEDILIFYKKLPTYNPQKIKGKERTKGGRKYKNNGCYGNFNEMPKEKYDLYHPTSIITFTNAMQRDKNHPTQKPVALFEYLIKTYTNEGDLVLDNCVGSGTTNIACLNTNRRCIGMEKDEKYFKIATKRLEEAKANIEVLQR